MDSTDTARLDAIEAELRFDAEQRLSTTDPFFSVLNACRQGQLTNTVNMVQHNNTADTHPAISAPLTRSAASASAFATPYARSSGRSAVYVKLNPYERWPYYVIFTGEHAGIYSSW